MIEAEFYKVTNAATTPIHMTWNKALLTPEDLEQYAEYQKSEEYIGLTEEDVATRKKIPEAVKIRPFFDILAKGVRIKAIDRVMIGKRNTAQPRYEWQFVIGPDVDKLTEDDDIYQARLLADEFEIKYDYDSDTAEIASKLKKKFGANEVILTRTQWLDSGLKNYEKKEIKLKLQPGETTRTIVVEGFLTARPMSRVEVQKFYDDEKAKTDKKIKEVKEKLEDDNSPKAKNKKD